VKKVNDSDYEKIEKSLGNAVFPGIDPVESPSKDSEKETFSEVTKGSLTKKKSKSKVTTPMELTMEFQKQYSTVDLPKCKSDYFSERFYKIGNYFVDCLQDVLEKDVKTLETKKKEFMLNPPKLPPWDPTRILLDYRKLLANPQFNPYQALPIWRPSIVPFLPPIPNNFQETYARLMQIQIQQKSREMAAMQQFQRNNKIQNQKKKKNKN
jgi:hypothetical protein